MADKLTLKSLSGELESLRSRLKKLELGVEHKIERGLEKAVARLQSRIANQEQRASTIAMGGGGFVEEERRKLIAETAYLYAERRGFCQGDPEQDWLEAEMEIDRLLFQGGLQSMPRMEAGAQGQSQQGH